MWVTGGRWTAGRESVIATVPVGYGDGYPWAAADGTPVAIGEHLVPLAGRVSMDMITIDVTDCGEISHDMPVTLWGNQPHVDTVARHAGTIGYELMTQLYPAHSALYLMISTTKYLMISTTKITWRRYIRCDIAVTLHPPCRGRLLLSPNARRLAESHTMASEQPEAETLLGAIDLGSNSFHLIIAKSDFGELRPVQTLAEKVQLGETSGKGTLTKAAILQGLACLERFKQLIDSTAPAKIRVVGTNALRRAKNRLDFIEPAEQILGAPIDVIYGREEARLIYLGVAHTLSDDEDTRLVVDGGSTEFILGQRFEPIRLESLQMGCVFIRGGFLPRG